MATSSKLAAGLSDVKVAAVESPSLAKLALGPQAGLIPGTTVVASPLTLDPSLLGPIAINPGIIAGGSLGGGALATPPPEPVQQPTYEKAVATFGTMKHIDPIRDHFIEVSAGIDDLRDIVEAGPSPLRARLEAYLEKRLEHPETYEGLIAELGASRQALFTKQKPALGAKFEVAREGADGSVQVAQVEHTSHSALFGTAAVVTDDIRIMEGLRTKLVFLRRQSQQRLAEAQADLAELEAQLPPARAKLDALARDRTTALDDYLAAQRLLLEHWRDVERAWKERQRVLRDHQGLFYVKVRETPVAVGLPDPLELRAASPDDLVPGCADRGVPLPEALAPFLDAVREIPAADWAALAGLSNLLPGRDRLSLWIEERRQQLALRTAQRATVAGALVRLHRESRTLLPDLAARPFGAASLVELQRQGHAILGLGDLIASPAPPLRDTARSLDQRLHAAAGCLLERLRGVSPSLRLAWAGAAESDELPVEAPERWSGIAQAEASDFNGIRTLAELVAWWFRQVRPDAAAGSRAAMRNLVRACLMLAAGDEPDELLQGRLKTVPGRFRVGDALRLELSREPRPGALLQLFDAAQKVIGTLRVDDHDAQGTVATVVTVLDPAAVLATSLRVSGKREG